MDKVYTPAEVSEHLGVPVKTLTDWRYKKTGPAWFPAGRFVRYKESAITAWQDESEAPQVEERKTA
jgi:hypothetical protein